MNMFEHLNYGSEEESDDLEINTTLKLVPRALRAYVEDSDYSDDEDDVDEPDNQPPSSHPSETTSGSPSGLKEFGPHKWEFKWEDIPENPVPPKDRRERFDSSNCGPTVVVDSPYEAFTSIWTPEIMELIARETNKYAEEVVAADTNISQWRATSPDELYVFFAIIIAAGVLGRTFMEECWIQNVLGTPWFWPLMTYDRFCLLRKCIHFRDNNDLNPQAMTTSQAKLFKIQPILDHLNDKFTTLYNVRRNVMLDESLTMWKGWVSGLRIIGQSEYEMAVEVVGIKSHEICDVQSGYLWRFEFQAEPQESSTSGTIPELVLRLVSGLEGHGHTIHMDNYYNSPSLARELKSRGLDCVGTVSANREFVPDKLARLTKRSMAKDEVRGNTAGDVDILVWRARKVVPFISTYHGAMTVDDPSGTMPAVSYDFNICACGVDRKDRILAKYPIERNETQVWYKKLFRRLLNVSVFNAYVLYKGNRPRAPLTHRQFREMLCQNLVDAHSSSPRTPAHRAPTPTSPWELR